MISGSSLVALFLVVAIAFWLFVRKRHGDLKVPNPKALSNGPELRGVGGWLRAYILLAYIGVPIIGIMVTERSLREVVAATPQLLGMTEFSVYRVLSYLIVAAHVGWHWWVAHRLQHRHEASSLRHVRVLLLAGPLAVALLDAAAATGAFGHEVVTGSLADWAFETLKSYKASVLWLLYFSFSKRVQNTYLQGTDLSPTAATGAAT